MSFSTVDKAALFDDIANNVAGWQTRLIAAWGCVSQSADDVRMLKIISKGSGGGGDAGLVKIFSGTVNTVGAGAPGLAAGFVINVTPLDGDVPVVSIDGANTLVGDGTTAAPCYFSNDSGVTARAYVDVAAGDSLYWNPTVAGYTLVGTEFYIIRVRTAS